MVKVLAKIMGYNTSGQLGPVLKLLPEIFPALVVGISGTAVGRGIPTWDAICPGSVIGSLQTG